MDTNHRQGPEPWGPRATKMSEKGVAIAIAAALRSPPDQSSLPPRSAPRISTAHQPPRMRFMSEASYSPSRFLAFAASCMVVLASMRTTSDVD